MNNNQEYHCPTCLNMLQKAKTGYYCTICQCKWDIESIEKNIQCPECPYLFSESKIRDHLAYFHKLGLIKAKAKLEELKK